MADYSHLGGAPVEHPDRLSDSVKKNMVTGTTVKSLDTGHTEASLKEHMSKEMELLAIGNGNFFTNLLDGLLGELIELIKKYLKDPLAILEDGFDLLIKVGGGALGLALELGEAFFGFISDIAGTVVSLFTNEPRQLPPAFSQLRADLEGDVAPFMESFKKNGENAAEALGKVGALREEVEQTIIAVERDIRSAEDALEAIGDVDKKIADQALIHIRDSEAALEEAKGAVEALAAYKDAIDPQIQSALAAAEDGIGRLDTLEPKVEKAISDLSAYEEDISLKVQDALGKANGALGEAEQALTQYDDLLSKHEGFQAAAESSLEALNTLTGQQQEKINNAVTGSVIEYAVGTSETTAPTTGWSTATPTRAAGRFTWMRSKVTYGSGEVATTSAALITGNTGTPGTPGTDGTPGKAGVGVKSTTVTYVTSASGATAPSSGWTAAVPTLTKGRYLWTKTLWTYTDDSTEIGYSVAYVAKDGSSGTDGLPGKDGTGITGTAITYAASSSGTVAPTSGWVASPPAGTPGQFIWTKTVWTYSDRTTETGYTVGKIGNTGAQGATGAKGATGATGGKGTDGISIASVTSYYQMVTKGASAPAKPTTLNPPSGWSATEPDWVAKRDLYRAERVTYSNGTFSWSAVSKVASFTAADKGIEDAAAATDALTNTVNTGMSLVTLIPGTTDPDFSSNVAVRKITVPEATGAPASLTAYAVNRRVTIPGGRLVNVSSGATYRISFKARASKSGSLMYLDVVTEDGSDSMDLDSFSSAYYGTQESGRHGKNLVNGLRLVTWWRNYETKFKFKSGVTRAMVRSIYFNHLAGAVADADQWISDLVIEPIVPSQDQVDDAQNKAIRSHQALFEGQHDWNAVATAAIKAQSDINDKQDGLIAANNKASAANTEAVAANTRVLNLVFPAQSAVPMVPGGVRNGGTDAKPVFENMPAWLEACTRVTSGLPTGVNASAYSTGSYTVVEMNHKNRVQVDPNIEYKYSAWVKASKLSDMNVGFRDQDNAYAVKSTKADPGSLVDHSYTSDLFWVKNIPSGWKKISGTVTFHDKVREVFIDKVTFNHTSGANTNAAQWLADIQITPNMPAQSEVNRALSEVNDAQNDILHDHQRILDLMNPPETVVAMYPGGLNIGTKTKPEYVEFPYWLRDSGDYITYGTSGLPDGNRVAVRKTTTTTPTINGHYVPVTPGGEYRYEFYFKATSANSGLVIYMTDDKGSAAFQSGGPDNPAYGNRSGHLWWSPNMPGGTGPDGDGFYRITGKLKVRDNVTRARISRIYYNWSSGSVTTTQTITGLRIWPDVPSQEQVDSSQNTAIEANTKAIRLAFPDMNLDPQTSAGHPQWSTPSTVTVKTTGSLGGRNPSYQINGTVDGGLMEFQPDIREYRIRGWITPGPGSNPFVYVYVMNESNTRIIEAWRPTFPVAATEAEELAGSGEVKWVNNNYVLFSANGGNAGNPGEWAEIDVVVRLRAGDTVGKIQLYSTAARWVTLSDFRVTTFSPSQWQVDYSQNKALSGLAHSITVQNTAQGQLENAIGENGLGGQVEDLEKTIRQVQSYIPRSMVMNLGATTPTFTNDHFKVYNDSGDVIIEALGGDTGWTGHAIFTYVYGTSHETDIVEFKIPDTSDGSRKKVRTTQDRAWRRMGRLDYWVDNGEQVTKKIAKSPNVAVASGWSTRSEMTFKVLETGFHIVNFKVEWPYTARNGIQYGVRIKRNGTVINTHTETNIGPTFPWESGRRSQSINWSGQLTVNQSITFEVYTTGSTTKWRTLGKEERRVSWVSK